MDKTKFAFVEFETEDDLNKALEKNQSVFGSQNICIERSSKFKNSTLKNSMI